MQKKLSSLLLIAVLSGCSNIGESKLSKILNNGSKEFKSTLKNSSHEIQIIYGEIVGDSIIHHTYGLDQNKFFYPASTVKMPVVFAALKKLEELGLSINDRLDIDSTQVYPRSVYYDSLFGDSIRFSSLIQQIFTFSDNTAYNHLYGWLGKDYINELYSLYGMDTRVIHQLSESAFDFNPKSNDYSRKSSVITEDDTLFLPETKQDFSFQEPIIGQQKGVGYIDSLGNLVNAPFDFSKKNFFPLEDLLTILEMAVRPDLVSGNKSYEFSLDTREFIQKTMELLPKDMPHPYDTLDDNYVKFLMVGNEEDGSIPPNIKIFNKVGWAYGYLIDVAYIQDTKQDIQFFLAAVIHVNSNRIYNDGIYEYEEIGLPFLDELGDLVYAHESR